MAIPLTRLAELAAEVASVAAAVAKLKAGGDGVALATVATVMERELRRSIAAVARRHRRNRAKAKSQSRDIRGHFRLIR
jgi:hypothetical protein